MACLNTSADRKPPARKSLPQERESVVASRDRSGKPIYGKTAKRGLLQPNLRVFFHPLV